MEVVFAISTIWAKLELSFGIAIVLFVLSIPAAEASVPTGYSHAYIIYMTNVTKKSRQTKHLYGKIPIVLDEMLGSIRVCEYHI